MENEERLKEATRIYVLSQIDFRKEAFQHSVEHGKVFLKTMSLLNGGAIVALLALIGALFGKSTDVMLVAMTVARDLRLAFGCFVTGVVMCAITAACGYANWNRVASTYQTTSTTWDILAGDMTAKDDIERQAKELAKNSLLAKIFLYTAIFAAFSSLVSFCCGACFALNALGSLHSH